MGFTDTEVNRRLLAAHGGDVEAVVMLLLNSGGDPHLLEVINTLSRLLCCRHGRSALPARSMVKTTNLDTY